MRIRLALALLVMLGASSAAFAAGGEQKDWDLGLHFGYVNPDSYGGLDPDNSDLWGIKVGYFFTERWSVEGAWQQASATGDVSGPDPDVDLDSLRVNGLWNFRAAKKFRWFLTAGLGREYVKAPDVDVDESDWSYNLGGGARWFFGKKRYWGLRADARWISADAGGDAGTQSSFEATGGLMWTFGGGEPTDADKDGVPDKKDTCAGTPKGARVDATGCPLDADKDGSPDGIDKCANTPAGFKVDSTGCPADNDGDGIADAVDKCPGTPKEAKVNSEGCPTEDADKDGVWDGADRCPNTPAGAKVDPVGCPMDADKDGVWDGLDQCPDTPAGTKVDEKGCPAA
jgi:OOP family OmpA-OmpF porin